MSESSRQLEVSVDFWISLTRTVIFFLRALRLNDTITLLHSGRCQMNEQPLIYPRLEKVLYSAKEALAHGDLESARINLDSARVLNSRIYRRHLRLERASAVDADWADQHNLSARSADSARISLQKINKHWQSIAVWFDSIISSVGEAELVKSEDGISILLDRRLDSRWDFANDIVILTGKNSKSFVEALVSRGQSKVIVVLERDAPVNMPIDTVAIPTGSGRTSAEAATILYVTEHCILTENQLDTIRAAEPPALTHISTEAVDKQFEYFESLVKQVEKEFILEASQSFLPVVFSNRFARNIPKIVDLPSISNLRTFFEGEPILIVSPGPSLLESLPAIKEFRDHFILISMLRSAPLLLDFDIVPDFAILSDAADHAEGNLNLIPEDDSLSQIPLIVTEYTHTTTLEAKFQHFIVIPTVELTGSPLSIEIHGKNPPAVVGTGVASHAVSLCAELGVESITLVGQDLSFAKDPYASEDQQREREQVDGLTCKGIDGEQHSTQDDYLQFIRELAYLGEKYGGAVALYNCTVRGAFLDNWAHLPLDSSHPVVIKQQSGSGRGGDISGWQSELTKSVESRDLVSALVAEISQLGDVEVLAGMLVEELQSLLDQKSSETTFLSQVEQELSKKMSTTGSFINFYTLPAKLEADASLQSVQSLDDNLMISHDYYLAVKVQSKRLSDMLIRAKSLVELVST
jgi:hypothetical protein